MSSLAYFTVAILYNLSLCVVRYQFPPNYFYHLIVHDKPTARNKCQKTLWKNRLVSPEKRVDMVFCFHNCSDLLSEKIVLVIKEKLLKFKAKG